MIPTDRDFKLAEWINKQSCLAWSALYNMMYMCETSYLQGRYVCNAFLITPNFQFVLQNNILQISHTSKIWQAKKELLLA